MCAPRQWAARLGAIRTIEGRCLAAGCPARGPATAATTAPYCIEGDAGQTFFWTSLGTLVLAASAGQ